MAINRERVANALTSRGAIKPCHRCGQTKFAVLESYSYFTAQDDFTAGLVIGGPSIPVAMVACENCGAITPHALGAIGLLPSAGEKKS